MTTNKAIESEKEEVKIKKNPNDTKNWKKSLVVMYSNAKKRKITSYFLFFFLIKSNQFNEYCHRGRVPWICIILHVDTWCWWWRCVCVRFDMLINLGLNWKKKKKISQKQKKQRSMLLIAKSKCSHIYIILRINLYRTISHERDGAKEALSHHLIRSIFIYILISKADLVCIQANNFSTVRNVESFKHWIESFDEFTNSVSDVKTRKKGIVGGITLKHLPILHCLIACWHCTARSSMWKSGTKMQI